MDNRNLLVFIVSNMEDDSCVKPKIFTIVCIYIGIYDVESCEL